jgi:hypothetical protein
MSDDDALLALLRAVRDGDDADEPMNNDTLSTRLGWTASDVATRLTSARDRLLVWGSRVGGTPAPRFADLELTVQGRRLLAAADTQQDG